MKIFFELPPERKLTVFEQTGLREKLPAADIEKDWWVTLALQAIFRLSFAEHIVFKGGTSLSKGWNLIKRFSEDIDIAISYEFLGFKNDISNTQVQKLRSIARKFIANEFLTEFQEEINKMGITGIRLEPKNDMNKGTDPLSIEMHYESVTEPHPYLLPKVIIEAGARSMMEPKENKPIQSMVGQQFPDTLFAEKAVNISIVAPKRTFLEKVFLLHEEFQKLPEKMNAERKSRHLYDLEKLMDTEHGIEALEDVKLYQDIIKHREKFTKIRGLNYNLHQAGTIDFIPPKKVISNWEKDYSNMRESMIYGDSLDFATLIKRLEDLKKRFHEIA